MNPIKIIGISFTRDYKSSGIIVNIFLRDSGNIIESAVISEEVIYIFQGMGCINNKFPHATENFKNAYYQKEVAILRKSLENTVNILALRTCNKLMIEKKYIKEIGGYIYQEFVRFISYKKVHIHTPVTYDPRPIFEKPIRKITALEYALYLYLQILVKIPESIIEALDIRNQAITDQKIIAQKTLNIKKRKNKYLKKHGTFFEKTGAYLKTYFIK